MADGQLGLFFATETCWRSRWAISAIVATLPAEIVEPAVGIDDEANQTWIYHARAGATNQVNY
jgi:hypothetical protein